MIIVELICRIKKKKRILQIGSFWLIFFGLCIFSSIIGGMRFGAISLFFMSLTAFIFIVIDNENFNKKAKGLSQYLY
jgi:Ca2+-dependent lipid-binding protein